MHRDEDDNRRRHNAPSEPYAYEGEGNDVPDPDVPDSDRDPRERRDPRAGRDPREALDDDASQEPGYAAPGFASPGFTGPELGPAPSYEGPDVSGPDGYSGPEFATEPETYPETGTHPGTGTGTERDASASPASPGSLDDHFRATQEMLASPRSLPAPAQPPPPAAPPRPARSPQPRAPLPPEPAARHLDQAPVHRQDRDQDRDRHQDGDRDRDTPRASQPLPRDAEPAPADPGPGPVGLGDPRHSGAKPPRYSPVPQGLPRAGDDIVAAVLPDTVLDGAAYGPLTVRAASVRGDSHRHLGEARQDALCVTRIGSPQDGELLLLAVADGVGSAERSHVGSNEVCRLAARYLDRQAAALYAALHDQDDVKFGELAHAFVAELATLLTDLAVRDHRPPEAYATTLRVLLVPVDPAVRTRGFLAVGDGGTALLRDGVWHPDVTREEGAGSGIIDTRTDALPSARTPTVHRLLHPAQPGDVMVLCTDGLSTPLAGDAGMRDFLRDAWGSGDVPAPADFLWQFQYRVKSYDDDRTAVVLWEGTP